jgi:hypothetical protein
LPQTLAAVRSTVSMRAWSFSSVSRVACAMRDEIRNRPAFLCSGVIPAAVDAFYGCRRMPRGAMKAPSPTWQGSAVGR